MKFFREEQPGISVPEVTANPPFPGPLSHLFPVRGPQWSFLPEASVAEPATGGEEEISHVAFLILLQDS